MIDEIKETIQTVSKIPNRAIHQFVPALIPRDATGIHTLLLRNILREAGWRSEIFAEATHDELIGETIRIEDYPNLSDPRDILIYQFSTSSLVADFLAKRSEPLILNYHNITTPELFANWDPLTQQRSLKAREQLQMLSKRTFYAIADSGFNEDDLIKAGYGKTAVVPVLFGKKHNDIVPDRVVAQRLKNAKSCGGADLIFVGRLVPSKNQHDLIKTLWIYRKLYDPLARLHLLGSAPNRLYLNALRDFSRELDLVDAVRIVGEVSDSSLAAYYEAADAYVSMSLHEGFAIPVVEAMRAGVPVLSLPNGALRETVADAGLLIESGDPAHVAAALSRVLSDVVLREKLVKAGHVRADSFSFPNSASKMRSVISNIAETLDKESKLDFATTTRTASKDTAIDISSVECNLDNNV